MKKIVLALVALVVAATAAGYWWSSRLNRNKAAVYNGILEATVVEVRAEVGGKVIAVLKEEGDAVAEGELICELDREKLALQLRGGRAELTAQKARLEAMRKGARHQEIEQARLARDQAELQRRKAEKDYARMERLYERNAVSSYERDNARTLRDLAAAQAARAGQAYQLVLAGVRDEELRAQLAIVDAARAKVEYYQAQMDDALIKSPLQGRLIERFVEPGELVLPGGLVATVTDYRKLKVKVYVAEAPVGRIKPGRKAAVRVDAFPGREFKGRVSRKSMQWEFTPKNVQTREERSTLVYEVTVEIENPDELAIAGLPADVTFVE